MTIDMYACPIWGTPANVIAGSGDWYTVNSPRTAGRYSISGSAAIELDQLTPEEKVGITFWMVEQRYKGSDTPRLYTSDVAQLRKSRGISVIERADWLLRFVEKSTKRFGLKIDIKAGFGEFNTIKVNDTYFSLLAWTSSIEQDEIDALLNYCSESGFLKLTKQNQKTLGGELINYTIKLTVEGFKKLQNSNKISGSDQAFVAMWFDDSILEIYSDGIKTAIEECGYRPLRLDQEEYNDKIDDAIIANIRRSRFMVADFTHGDEGPRSNVYYEAGFAHGINIPVIFTCREDQVDRLHFDVRQHNCIRWTNASVLKEQLKNRIQATII